MYDMQLSNSTREYTYIHVPGTVLLNSTFYAYCVDAYTCTSYTYIHVNVYLILNIYIFLKNIPVHLVCIYFIKLLYIFYLEGTQYAYLCVYRSGIPNINSFDILITFNIYI